MQNQDTCEKRLPSFTSVGNQLDELIKRLYETENFSRVLKNRVCGSYSEKQVPPIMGEKLNEPREVGFLETMESLLSKAHVIVSDMELNFVKVNEQTM